MGRELAQPSEVPCTQHTRESNDHWLMQRRILILLQEQILSSEAFLYVQAVTLIPIIPPAASSFLRPGCRQFCPAEQAPCLAEIRSGQPSCSLPA
jgi:hypothetical protein